MSRSSRSRQAISDGFHQLSSVALYALAAALFLAGALAGLTMVSRLGGAGWFMYGVVIGTWGLVFGPVVASAHALHERGSRATARPSKRA